MDDITIIGKGWVGTAMKQLFPNAYVYSRTIGTKEEVNKRRIAFICIPTPNLSASESPTEKSDYDNKGEGKLDTSAIEEIISWLQVELIVIRSTVNPGDCDR